MPRFRSSAPTNNDEANAFHREQAKRFAEKKKRALEKDVAKIAHKRKEAREEFSVVAELSFPDKGFHIDGLVTEASRGGLTFRPATSYVVEIIGERIQVIVDRIKRNGVIRSTRENGYGSQLLDELTDGDLKILRNTSIALHTERDQNAA